MAFSLQQFKDNPTTGIKSTVDTIIPYQIKNFSSELDTIIKSGTSDFNNILGNLTGINLSQTNLTQQIQQVIIDQTNVLAEQLESQLVGCVNKVIRDFLNEHPTIEKIIFFEETINRYLSEFRINLERKIDQNLRKLAYNKLKVYQIALLRQKILDINRSICPGSTPAPPRTLAKLKDKLQSYIKTDTSVGDSKNTIPKTEISELKSEKPKPIPSNDLPPQTVKKLKEDSNYRTQQIQAKIEETRTEIKKISDSLVSSTQKVFNWEDYA